VFLLLLCLARARPDEPLAAIVQAGPGPIQVNTPWVITLLVDHDRPEELKVELPPLTGSLVLERLRTEPRVMEGAGEEIWTQVECTFIPAREGRAELEFLRVLVPGREFVTGRLGVEVLGVPPASGSYRPRLSWAAPLPLFRVGEKAELTLLLSDWDPAKPLNFPLPFYIELSPLLILESRTPAGSGREANAVLVLSCIPLEAGTVSLPPPRLEYQGESLSAPPLRFTVQPALPAANTAPFVHTPPGASFSPGVHAPPGANSPSGVHAPPGGNVISANGGNAFSAKGASSPESPASAEETQRRAVFPRKNPPPLPFIRASYMSLAERAEAYWEKGEYARALAALREGERDLGAGPALASLRLEAEKALGLDFTYDEPWRPRLLLRVVFILLSFVLVALCLWGILRRARGGPFRVSAGVLFAGLLLGIGAAALAGKGFSGPGNKAVLCGGAAYRTPDLSSGLSAEFREGQPALIRARTALWVYAETYDGLSGWVPGDRVIPY
jgi:hypothetical protein